MDQLEYFAGGDKASPTRRELQGARPTPLKIHKESHKIKKPPVAPPPRPPSRQPQQPAPTADHRQPVIIYAVSPKVIHTTVPEFMTLVQRLTGSSSSSSSSSAAASGGDVSPAARLASIEKTSPSEREKATSELMGMVEGVVEVGNFPGILSPAPAALPPIPAGFFSPELDPHGFSMLNDLSFSPLMYGSNNMFVPSPSTLFSSPMVSPSPSSYDILSQFLDF